MFRNFKLVSQVIFGRGSFNQLDDILGEKRSPKKDCMVFLVDDVFKDKPFQARSFLVMFAGTCTSARLFDPLASRRVPWGPDRLDKSAALLLNP